MFKKIQANPFLLILLVIIIGGGIVFTGLEVFSSEDNKPSTQISKLWEPDGDKEEEEKEEEVKSEDSKLESEPADEADAEFQPITQRPLQGDANTGVGVVAECDLAIKIELREGFYWQKASDDILALDFDFTKNLTTYTYYPEAGDIEPTAFACLTSPNQGNFEAIVEKYDSLPDEQNDFVGGFISNNKIETTRSEFCDLMEMPSDSCNLVEDIAYIEVKLDNSILTQRFVFTRKDNGYLYIIKTVPSPETISIQFDSLSPSENTLEVKNFDF